MRPYYFDFDQPRTLRATAIVRFERSARGGWPRRPPRPRALDWLAAGIVVLCLWRRRIRERDQLAGLDARLLRDIGVTPNQADFECNKPFWRE